MFFLGVYFLNLEEGIAGLVEDVVFNYEPAEAGDLWQLSWCRSASLCGMWIGANSATLTPFFE